MRMRYSALHASGCSMMQRRLNSSYNRNAGHIRPCRATSTPASRRYSRRSITSFSTPEKESSSVEDSSQRAGQQQHPAVDNAAQAAAIGNAQQALAQEVTMTWQNDARVMFAIPPANLDTPMTEVLPCPTMRDILGQPHPTPLTASLSGIWEGRYVSDDDRVVLNVMDFSSPTSTGAHGKGLALVGSSSQEQASPSGSSMSPDSSTHLALASGVYGGPADSLSLSSLDSWLSGLEPHKHQQRVTMPLPPFAMRAGPREQIYYDPAQVTAAIVATGGICPGMNDVTQAIVKRLGDYGVDEENVLGIRYGMRGFTAKDAKPVVLTHDKIEGIHLTGGTILGSSSDQRMQHRHRRHQQPHGPGSDSNSSFSEEDATSDLEQDTGSSSGASGAMHEGDSDDQLEAILDKLDFWRINMLFVIGGQGGNQLAAELAAGCQRRAIPCCIVGVPKSIDNDVMLVDRTFGFDTVVQEVVQRPLLAAKTEAMSARKGVGLVKVFGRRSGFIALQASLASGVVDVCLIPEEDFDLDGPAGLLEYVKQLLERQGHAVICVAEGAGQKLMYPGGEAIPVDEAGNPVLRDIGKFLKKSIKAAVPDADIKYIDPTYMVQAVPCTSQDHIYCKVLGFHAVDAAFAGYTGVMVAQVNGHFALLPSSVVTQSARRVDPKGKSWNRLRAAIGQPRLKNTGPADLPRPAAAAPEAGRGQGGDRRGRKLPTLS